MGEMVDTKLRSEVVNLFQYIQRLREEVAAMAKPGENGSAFDSMSAQLDAIITSTEDATHAILEATETIDEAAIGLRGEKDPEKVGALCDTLSQQSMAIMEACSFQDITGQRITKVVNALKEIEARVDSLIAAFGDEIAEIKAQEAANPKKTDAVDGNNSDATLLNGPQLEGEGNSQDEIDKLFD